MTEDDPLREILGEELYAELDSIEIDPEEMGEDFIKMMEKLTPEILDAIATGQYEAAIAFEGADAFELVSTLRHAGETGCKECFTALMRFSAEIVAHMWYEILSSEGIIEEEGDEDA